MLIISSDQDFDKCIYAAIKVKCVRVSIVFTLFLALDFSHARSTCQGVRLSKAMPPTVSEYE